MPSTSGSSRNARNPGIYGTSILPLKCFFSMMSCVSISMTTIQQTACSLLFSSFQYARSTPATVLTEFASKVSLQTILFFSSFCMVRKRLCISVMLSIFVSSCFSVSAFFLDPVLLTHYSTLYQFWKSLKQIFYVCFS